MDAPRIPRTLAEVAELEATYRPFEPVARWVEVTCDGARWQRHVDALRAAVRAADPDAWRQLRERFLRAAALDSAVLDELVRPAPDLTDIVLRGSLGDGDWSSVTGSGRLVVECHRRALVVATDVAASGRALDPELIARLQDLIVEAQLTYTVTVDDGSRVEVELPKRQYKPVSNYLLDSEARLVSFAPAASVAREMERFCAELASEDFARLHPVVQAAYTHVALTRIHPFADGNGRLARTLASLPLLREAGLPQVILADQWPAYARALDRAGEGDVQAVVELFLAVQVNTMELARTLLGAATAAVPGLAELVAGSPERTLIDLVRVHLRQVLGVPADDRVALTGAGLTARVARTDRAGLGSIVELTVGTDADEPRWLSLRASTGESLEFWQDDVHPLPLEIVHLRLQAWLAAVVGAQPAAVRPEPAARARALLVLGVPRSGTTVMGNWIGSHPAVLGLAEYGGLYVAHSVAPSYLAPLPGRQHEAFLAELRELAVDHVAGVAREQGATWFCDATPWNLQVAGALARSLPDAVFVLMLRHFSGAVLSLQNFHWADSSVEGAARLWVTLNGCLDQLPEDRTLVVSYDALNAHPEETVAGVRDVLASLGLDPALFDDTQFCASHAAVVGSPRPTIGRLADGRVRFTPIRSLDTERWTPQVHAAVWPIVADTHRALLDRFPGVYLAPQLPPAVPAAEW